MISSVSWRGQSDCYVERWWEQVTVELERQISRLMQEPWQEMEASRLEKWEWGKREEGREFRRCNRWGPLHTHLEGYGGWRTGQCKEKAQIPGSFTEIERKSRFEKKYLEHSFGFAEFVALLRCQVDRWLCKSRAQRKDWRYKWGNSKPKGDNWNPGMNVVTWGDSVAWEVESEGTEMLEARNEYKT